MSDPTEQRIDIIAGPRRTGKTTRLLERVAVELQRHTRVIIIAHSRAHLDFLRTAAGLPHPMHDVLAGPRVEQIPPPMLTPAQIAQVQWTARPQLASIEGLVEFRDRRDRPTLFAVDDMHNHHPRDLELIEGRVVFDRQAHLVGTLDLGPVERLLIRAAQHGGVTTGPDNRTMRAHCTECGEPRDGPTGIHLHTGSLLCDSEQQQPPTEVLGYAWSRRDLDTMRSMLAETLGTERP